MSSRLRNKKPPRQQSVEGQSSRISSTQAGQRVNTMPTWYIGVVPQRKGYWSAEIYFKDRVISLGRFKSEVAAARAYDSVAITQHGNDFARNFLLTNATIHEPAFQSNYTNEAIVHMIMDGSYEHRLIQFVSNQHRAYCYSDSIAMPTCLDTFQGVFYKKIYHKELTSTDLENQNMLILPNYVLPFFPPFRSDRAQFWLEFNDRMNKTWAFHYIYMTRIQSFVITMGWSLFVNEMELRAKDIVVFYVCSDRRIYPEEFFDMIDIIRGVRISQ
ncbi:AP2/ERF and B3 domain-containing transcription factor At1g51120-like [Phalaenopsis equestris]|uniref:AP2/ERF and B3 domain-containing transcription factor At1g51120-like n=1 Tax=Phalaenopsis equestris TaxID=78828 RepID=UPI0009E55C05|nr:AP2/ERF and B3 domain-containing transcription factor At1g51120-like [Phalaenopsis equestris]